MNERMMRVAPKAAAEFITAFSEGKGKVGDSTWLVWAYEGDDTLADLMQASQPTAAAGLPAHAAGRMDAPGVRHGRVFTASFYHAKRCAL